MTEPFAWDQPHPATTPKPEPTARGLVVHTMLDISMYAGLPEYDRYIVAANEDEEARALAAMPLATATFFEAPEGMDPFDPDSDHV